MGGNTIEGIEGPASSVASFCNWATISLSPTNFGGLVKYSSKFRWYRSASPKVEADVISVCPVVISSW